MKGLLRVTSSSSFTASQAPFHESSLDSNQTAGRDSLLSYLEKHDVVFGKRNSRRKTEGIAAVHFENRISASACTTRLTSIAILLADDFIGRGIAGGLIKNSRKSYHLSHEEISEEHAPVTGVSSEQRGSLNKVEPQ